MQTPIFYVFHLLCFSLKKAVFPICSSFGGEMSPFMTSLIYPTVFAMLVGGNAGKMTGLGILVPDVADLGASISK